ncbi:MAG: hypothetical protein M0R06_16220, partial [Sphaerochaeta sp.]|nr:hypothetical protein [Sphaerochaeta sp.]
GNITGWDITCWDITCWDITCRNINCGNITCWDITCWDITCWNISFYAFLIAYISCSVKSWKGRRTNHIAKCLDSEIVIRK